MKEGDNPAKKAEERKIMPDKLYDEDLARAVWDYVQDPSNKIARFQLANLATERRTEDKVLENASGFSALIDAFELRLEDEITALENTLTVKISSVARIACDALEKACKTPDTRGETTS